MTNRIALWLGLILVGCILLDGLFFGWSATVFLSRKFSALIEYIAFWR